MQKHNLKIGLIALSTIFLLASCKQKGGSAGSSLIHTRGVEIKRIIPFVSWGGPEASEERMLGGPSDFVITSVGEFVVSDAILNQIVFFTKDGRLIRRVGRKGQGPLEFTTPYRIAQVGDTLVVWEINANRLQYLTLDGRFIATVKPNPAFFFEPVEFARKNIYKLTGGVQADSLIYIYNYKGERIDMFGTLEAPRIEILNMRETKEYARKRQIAPTLKNTALPCLTSDGHLFILHNALPLLKKYTLDGELVFRKELEEDSTMQALKSWFFAANDTSRQGFSYRLRYWLSVAPDHDGGFYALPNLRANKSKHLLIYHFSRDGELTEKFVGPQGIFGILKSTAHQLWAFNGEDFKFYGFQLGRE